MPNVGQRFNPYRTFNGIFIPESVARYKGIGPAAKLIYGRLIRYAGESGEAYPTVPSLAEEVGISRSQAFDHLAELVENSFLEVESRSGKSSVYFFLWHPCFDGDVGEPRHIPVRKTGRVEEDDPSGKPDAYPSGYPDGYPSGKPDAEQPLSSNEESQYKRVIGRESDAHAQDDPPSPLRSEESERPQESSPSSPSPDKQIKWALERLKGFGKISGAKMRRITESLGRRIGVDEIEQLIADFDADGWWRDGEVRDKLGAFLAFAGRWTAPNLPRAVPQDIPQSRQDSLQSTITPDPVPTSQPTKRINLIESWDEILPDAPVKWEGSRESRLIRARVAEAEGDLAVSVTDWKLAFETAKKIRAAGSGENDWLGFRWLFKDGKSGELNWRTLVRGDLNWMGKKRLSRSEQKRIDEEAEDAKMLAFIEGHMND